MDVVTQVICLSYMVGVRFDVILEIPGTFYGSITIMYVFGSIGDFSAERLVLTQVAL